MNKVLIAVVVVLGVVVVAFAAYTFILIQDNGTMADELRSIRTDLTSTQAELAETMATLTDTQQTLATTQVDFDATRLTLTSIQADLKSTNRTLTLAQSELASTKEDLDQTQQDLDTTKQDLDKARSASKDLEDRLSTTQQKLNTAQATLLGLGISIYTSKQNYDAVLVDNTTAQNPTLKQVKDFISADRTEKHIYIAGEYDCSQYSRDVHNNAEAAGIRTAVVHVNFQGELGGHALNAFLTTDFGLVYVDCTQPPDTVARVKKDKVYRAYELAWANGTNSGNDGWWDGLASYYYMRSSTGGEAVTESIKIFW